MTSLQHQSLNATPLRRDLTLPEFKNLIEDLATVKRRAPRLCVNANVDCVPRTLFDAIPARETHAPAQSGMHEHWARVWRGVTITTTEPPIEARVAS